MKRTRGRREVLRLVLRGAGGAALLALTPALRLARRDPAAVARRFGLRVVPLPQDDLRRNHDLAG